MSNLETQALRDLLEEYVKTLDQESVWLSQYMVPSDAALAELHISRFLDWISEP